MDTEEEEKFDINTNIIDKGVEYDQKKIRKKRSSQIRQKWCLTIVMYMTIIGHGLFFGIMGPSLVDLEHQTGSTVQTVATLFTWRNLGMFLGNLWAGVMFDCGNPFLLLGGATFMIAISMGFGSWLTVMWCQLAPILVGFGITGVASAFVLVGTCFVVMSEWRDKGGVVLQIMHAFGILAASTSPQIIRPFLTPSHNNDTYYKNMTIHQDILLGQTTNGIYWTSTHSSIFEMNQTELVNMTSQDSVIVEPGTQIHFAYILVACYEGILCLIYCLLFHIKGCDPFQFYKQKETDQNVKSKEISASKAKFEKLFLCLAFMFSVLYGMIEDVSGGLLFTFVVECLGWSKEKGTIINTAYWFTLAVGKITSGAAGVCIKPVKLLLMHIICSIIATLTLVFAFQFHEVIVWVFTCLLGFGISTIFGTIIAWGSDTLQLTGKRTSVYFTGLSLGKMTAPPLVGYLFQTLSGLYYLYFDLGLCICFLIIWCITVVVIKKYKPVANRQSVEYTCNAKI